MDIIVTRAQGPLVLSLTGKMDGFGSQKVSESLQTSLLDSDRSIIFDLSGVDYISSAGLRILQEAYRKMRERQGSVIICNVGEFVHNILKMGGFLQALTLCSTLDDALVHGQAAIPASKPSESDPSFFESETLEKGETTLHVMGNLSAINQGRVTIQDVRPLVFQKDEYQIGIGAVGNSVSDVEQNLGEMVTLHGSMMWVPADGNQTPDYFTGDIMSGGTVSRYSIFSVTQEGPFQCLLRMKNPEEGDVSIQRVADEVIQFSRNFWPDFRGICSVAMKATIGGLCTSDIVSPIIPTAREMSAKTAKPEATHSLYLIPGGDTLLEKVSHDDTKGRYHGQTVIAFGYIVDRERAGRVFPPEIIEQIALSSTPMHPSRIFINFSGAVLKDIPWNSGFDITTAITQGLEKGTMTAMHHLLGISNVRNATLVIAPVSSIHQS